MHKCMAIGTENLAVIAGVVVSMPIPVVDNQDFRASVIPAGQERKPNLKREEEER